MLQDIKRSQRQKCMCVGAEFLYLNTTLNNDILCKENIQWKLYNEQLTQPEIKKVIFFKINVREKKYHSSDITCKLKISK